MSDDKKALCWAVAIQRRKQRVTLSLLRKLAFRPLGNLSRTHYLCHKVPGLVLV